MKIAKAILISIMLVGLAACTSSATKLSRDAINGNLAGVRSRVQSGVDVNEYDKWGWTPLHWAIYYRTLPVAKFLLENGADPNVQTDQAYGSMHAGSTPLMISAYYGLPDFTELLLKRGANPDIGDDAGVTAMDYAKRYRFTKVIELLESKTTSRSPKPTEETE